MKIPFMWEKDWKIYREELKAFRGNFNLINFKILSALLFLTEAIFLYQNLYFPNRVAFPWLRTGYTILHSCGIGIALLMALFVSMAGKKEKSELINIGAVFFSFTIIGLGTMYTVFDYITYQNITAIVVASLGICIMLSSVPWVYIVLDLWGFALFFVCHELLLKDIANPGTLISMGFLTAISSVLGVYLQSTRVRMQILSLKLEERNRELKAIMIRDPLTGAYNRLFLEGFLDNQIHSTIRYGDYTSILMLDIDHFKKVNDHFGHLQGDSVLKKMVEILSANIRDSDLIARIGGEEFLVLLPRTNQENAFYIAEKLRTLVGSTRFENIPWPVTVSIGVGCLSNDENLDAALARIDTALYSAKRKGRNRVELLGRTSASRRRKRTEE
jgi:diguanylate cyclase (GGDEF)-like protein